MFLSLFVRVINHTFSLSVGVMMSTSSAASTIPVMVFSVVVLIFLPKILLDN